MSPSPAVTSSHLTLFSVVLVIGLVIGVLGHLVRSRALMLVGIAIIGAASAYFSFVLQPGGH